MITLVPAYGRDYTSLAKVKEAFNAGADFLIQDISSEWDGRYANKDDLHAEHTEVRIRYSKLRKVAIVKVQREGGMNWKLTRREG